MKILVVGNGAREHAICYKLSSEASAISKIFIAEGNGGTAGENLCENINIKPNDINGLLAFAKAENIGLTVVGQEEALALGIADIFAKEGLPLFGVNKASAAMEASKSFAKQVMQRASIPTANFKEFTEFSVAEIYIKTQPLPIVIKADGLAAGKGVAVAKSYEEAIAFTKDILINNIFGSGNIKVVIEEFMHGEEATYLALTDGNSIIPLDVSQDHKQVYDNDDGANTGGMGAYTPAPIINKSKFDFITEKIARPMITELRNMGISYSGVIYAGLMVTDEDIKVVEFNVRFGDPECQVVLSRIMNPILPLLLGSAMGEFPENYRLERSMNNVITVVLSSKGYPNEYIKGYEITGIKEAEAVEGVKVFHAGTKIVDGKLVTNGGRVLSVTATAITLTEAKRKAYEAIKCIHFEGMHYRTDIADKGIKRS